MAPVGRLFASLRGRLHCDAGIPEQLLIRQAIVGGCCPVIGEPEAMYPSKRVRTEDPSTMPSGALLLNCCTCRICASAGWGSTADAGCLPTGYYQWSLALQKFADVHRLVRDGKTASNFERPCLSFEDFIPT